MKIGHRTSLVVGAASITVAVVGVATVAFAGSSFTGVDGNGVIHGCFQNQIGLLRVINPAVETCNPAETAISWSQGGGSSGAGLTQLGGQHNAGTVTTAGVSTNQAADAKVADTITFTVPTGVSFELNVAAQGIETGGYLGGGQCTNGDLDFSHIGGPMLLAVDGTLSPSTIGGLLQGAPGNGGLVSSAEFVIGSGQHTLALEVAPQQCNSGVDTLGSQSLTNSYLSVTEMGIFNN